MDVVNRIIDLIEKNGIEQKELANHLNTKSQTISDWKSGKTKSYKKYLNEIAQYFDVSVDYLLNGTTPSQTIDVLPQDKIRMVPLYESVSAGFGAYANSEVIGYEPVYIESDYESEETIAIKVKGDSMYPKIEDGDIIVVIRGLAYENGDIVAVMIGDEGFVKRIRLYPDKIILESVNPEYQDREFYGKDMNSVNVVGVVKRIIKLV